MRIELEFEAPKGSRLHRRGFDCGITTFWDYENQGSIWWDYTSRKWVQDFPEIHYGLSLHAPCRSLKAFKRHLRKHAKELVGRKIILVNCFVGYNIIGRVYND